MSEPSTPEALVSALEGHNEGAAALARLASIAARIEPELLRALRLRVLTGTGVSAEGDLFWSDLCETRNPTGIVLRPDVTALLRNQIGDKLGRAHEVVTEVHALLPALLRLEEEITWRALSDPDPALIEEQLRPLVSALVTSEADRHDLAVWAYRALPRLPEPARLTPSFWTLVLRASHALGGLRLPVEGEPPLVALRGLHRRAFQGIGDVAVVLARSADVLRLRPASEAGEPAGEGQITLAVPAMSPIVLEVSSSKGDRVVSLLTREWTAVDVEGTTIRIRSVDGREHEIVSEELPTAQAGESTPRRRLDSRRAMARITIGGRQFSGYLVAPSLVATSSRVASVATNQPGEPCTVVIDGVHRTALVTAVDERSGAAILQLDAPLLGIVPCRLAYPSGLQGRFRLHGTVVLGGRGPKSFVAEGRLPPHLLLTEAPFVELDTDVPQAVDPEGESDRGAQDSLSGTPVLVDERVVGHVHQAEVGSYFPDELKNSMLGEAAFERAHEWTTTRILMSHASAIATLLGSVQGEEDDRERDGGDSPSTPVESLGISARPLNARVDRDRSEFRRRPMALDLGRTLQRKVANTDVRDLSQRPERRVQGFIAIGMRADHTGDVASQLHSLIEDLDPRLDLHMTEPIDVSRALVRGASRDPTGLLDMVRRLGVVLGQEWGKPLRAALEAKAPPRMPGRHRILWLDFRVLSTLPVKDDVAGWMAFCVGHLVPALPPGVDAVVTLAVEVPDDAPKDTFGRLTVAIERLANLAEHRTDQIRFTVLPPLGHPPPGEVLQFLDEAGCPQGLRQELAGLLYALKDYAAMRTAVERGLADGWFDLARELRGGAGTVAPDDGI